MGTSALQLGVQNGTKVPPTTPDTTTTQSAATADGNTYAAPTAGGRKLLNS